MLETLVFIPARAGSKGIPGKNMIPFGDAPLISHTFAIAKQLEDLSVPFVSTDCPRVLSLAGEFGFDTEYVRPASLAEDDSPIIDAILHGLEWLESKGGSVPQSVLLLQPTSPLRSVNQVRQALEIFKESQMQSLVSVHEMREHPYECVFGDSLNWEFLRKPSKQASRRQDYDERFYYIDGSIYLASVDFIKENKSLVKPGETYLFQTENRFNIDIDEPEDLEVAQALLKFRNKKTKYGRK